MDHTNKGVLFQNDKGDNDKRPDYRGKGNWNGKEFEVSGWKRISKDNKPYLSLSFSEPYEKTGGAWEQQRQKFAEKKDVAPAEVPDEISLEDIPF